VKLHENVDGAECKQSFEREVHIAKDHFRVKAYCMEGDNAIRTFDSGVYKLRKQVIPEGSKFEWRGDGKVLLTMKKLNAPSFWKYLLEDPKKEATELQVWWDMREKYIEELEEYMHEDGEKSEL